MEVQWDLLNSAHDDVFKDQLPTPVTNVPGGARFFFQRHLPSQQLQPHLPLQLQPQPKARAEGRASVAGLVPEPASLRVHVWCAYNTVLVMEPSRLQVPSMGGALWARWVGGWVGGLKPQAGWAGGWVEATSRVAGRGDGWMSGGQVGGCRHWRLHAA